MTENKRQMLTAEKQALYDCIEAAESDEEKATFIDMLVNFTALYPEI